MTVPTPVDAQNRPDLGAVLSATGTIAGLIDPHRRTTIIYESTVYPGVTEDMCGPEIERLTGFKHGRDFRLGYSPERINPGDREHTVDRIIKVIAGEDEEVVEQHRRDLWITIGIFPTISWKACSTPAPPSPTSRACGAIARSILR